MAKKTDIVEQLREFADLFLAAADEIEQLRMEVKRWKHNYKAETTRPRQQ